MPYTRGISPKVLADLIVSVLTFALVYFGIEVDAVLSATIAKAAGAMTAILAPPGDVVHPDVGPASDDLLSTEASSGIARAEG